MPRTLLVSLVLSALAALPAPASASSGQSMTFEAPRELLAGDPALRDATLDEISAFGVRQLRVVMYWHAVGPDRDSSTVPGIDLADPNAYPPESWAVFDGLFAAARQRGMTILLTVSGPVPRWATAARNDNLTRPDADRFRQFVTAVGRRYGEQISMWSVWNEPQQPQFLLPQFRNGRPYSPRMYRRLYLAALAGLRASGNGGDTVLMGETSPRGTGRVVAPITFMREVLCLSKSYKRDRSCGRLDADGYAHHAYTTRAGPSFRPPGKNDVTIGVLSRLTRALDKAGRAGAIRRNMPVYLTEFGVQSEPDPFIGVSLRQQAEFRSIAERIAYRNRRVRSFSQYLMRDDAPRPGSRFDRYSGFESGLRGSDGEKKPAYDEFRTPLAADRRGRRVSLWGLVRPGAGGHSVTVEYADGSGAFRTLRTVTTDSRGYWTATTSYRSRRSWRVRWTAPNGTVFTGPPARAY